MSGLSQLQRGILRLALAVNQYTQHGTASVKTGATVPGYRVPTVDYAGPKDLRLPLLLWGVGGLVPHRANDQGFFTHSARTRSIKAGIVRATTRLLARGLLVYAPLPLRYPRKDLPDWGYVLTAEGLAAAGCEPPEVPGLAQACEVFGITRRAEYARVYHADEGRRWHAIDFLQRLPLPEGATPITAAEGNGYRGVQLAHAVAVERQHQVSRCNGYRDVDIANAVTVTDESTATDVAPCDTGNRCEVPS